MKLITILWSAAASLSIMPWKRKGRRNLFKRVIVHGTTKKHCIILTLIKWTYQPWFKSNEVRIISVNSIFQLVFYFLSFSLFLFLFASQYHLSWLMVDIDVAHLYELRRNTVKLTIERIKTIMWQNRNKIKNAVHSYRAISMHCGISPRLISDSFFYTACDFIALLVHCVVPCAHTWSACAFPHEVRKEIDSLHKSRLSQELNY